jgi:hypothetical protein
VNVIGFDEASVRVARASPDAEDSPGQDFQEDGGDRRRTIHGHHLTGKLRIESDVAAIDSATTRTSTKRPASAEARTE